MTLLKKTVSGSTVVGTPGFVWEVRADNNDLAEAAIDAQLRHAERCASLQPGDLVAWDALLIPIADVPAGACVFLGKHPAPVPTNDGRLVPGARWWLLLPTGERIQYGVLPYGMQIISRASAAEGGED